MFSQFYTLEVEPQRSQLCSEDSSLNLEVVFGIYLPNSPSHILVSALMAFDVPVTSTSLAGHPAVIQS